MPVLCRGIIRNIICLLHLCTTGSLSRCNILGLNVICVYFSIISLHVDRELLCTATCIRQMQKGDVLEIASDLYLCVTSISIFDPLCRESQKDLRKNLLAKIYDVFMQLSNLFNV